jgi:hypothetical protein
MNIQRTILTLLLLVLTLSTFGCGGEKKSNNDTDTGVDVAINDKPITNAVDGKAYTYRADFGDWNNNTDVTFTIKTKPDWLLLMKNRVLLAVLPSHLSTLMKMLNMSILISKLLPHSAVK